MIIDRRLISNFDWILFLLTIAISIIGIITIYSATQGGDIYERKLYIKQIYWTFYGIGIMLFIVIIDYHSLARWSYFLYAVVIGLLIYVLFKGRVISGSQRWIFVGGVTIQVSELAKITLILILARFFNDNKLVDKYTLGTLFLPVLIVAIPFILIAKQPDLGTSLMLIFIMFFMTIFVGIHLRSLLFIIALGIFSLPLGWFLLKDYQKLRVLNLINPDLDPMGMGYHTLQSKIAIGSGKVWGKGLFHGTQSRLNFLPERHTDFIFSIFAEETGFAGSVLLVVIYTILLIKCIDIIYNSRDRLGIYISVGVVSMLGMYIIFNIGMTLGIFPVVGIPLPLMSYGGSSVVTTYMSIALLLNIKMRKFLHE